MTRITADSSAPPAARPPPRAFQAVDEDVVASRLAVIIGCAARMGRRWST